MRRVEHVETEPDQHEVYAWYPEWHDHRSRGRAFVHAASKDLGLDPRVLYEGIDDREGG